MDHDPSDYHVLCDCLGQGIHVVGYPASKRPPFIPECILIREDGCDVVLNKNGNRRPKTIDLFVPTDVWLSQDNWLIVNISGEVEVMSPVDIRTWANRISSDLVKEASSIKGDPIRALKLLEQSASLMCLDLEKLTATLAAQRANGDEDLGHVFLRVRGNPEGARKA